MPTLIDTREAFRRLRDQGGFTDEQADAIVDLFTDVDEQVATQGDIEQLRADTKSAIERLAERIDQFEKRVEQRFEAIDQRFETIDQRFESLEERFDQRFEAFENQVDQRFEAAGKQRKSELESLESELRQDIQDVRTSIVGSVAAVGAMLAVLIPLAIYFLG